MLRDLVVLVLVVALFAVAGWLIPRCSLDLVGPTPSTTSTTDFRDVGRAPSARP